MKMWRVKKERVMSAQVVAWALFISMAGTTVFPRLSFAVTKGDVSAKKTDLQTAKDELTALETKKKAKETIRDQADSDLVSGNLGGYKSGDCNDVCRPDFSKEKIFGCTKDAKRLFRDIEPNAVPESAPGGDKNWCAAFYERNGSKVTGLSDDCGAMVKNCSEVDVREARARAQRDVDFLETQITTKKADIKSIKSELATAEEDCENCNDKAGKFGYSKYQELALIASIAGGGGASIYGGGGLYAGLSAQYGLNSYAGLQALPALNGLNGFTAINSGFAGNMNLAYAQPGFNLGLNLGVNQGAYLPGAFPGAFPGVFPGGGVQFDQSYMYQQQYQQQMQYQQQLQYQQQYQAYIQQQQYQAYIQQMQQRAYIQQAQQQAYVQMQQYQYQMQYAQQSLYSAQARYQQAYQQAAMLGQYSNYYSGAQFAGGYNYGSVGAVGAVSAFPAFPAFPSYPSLAIPNVLGGNYLGINAGFNSGIAGAGSLYSPYLYGANRGLSIGANLGINAGGLNLGLGLNYFK